MILFPIEIGNREIISKLFLACKFAEKGYPCFIGKKNQIWNMIDRCKTPVYFDKGYHKNVSEGIYEKIKRKGGLIISLDEENGVDLKNNSTLNHRFPDSVFKYFDLVFLWGSKQFNYLKANRKHFPVDHVFAFGHPRFELLNDKFRNIYSKDIKTISDKYGKYILINTSFGLGNNLLGDDFVVKNYSSRIQNLKEIISYQKRQAHHFIDLVKYLTLHLDKNIIIRPHPEENQDFYMSVFHDIKRVHIVYKGPVIPWIIGSDFMIQHDCTTAIEAAMLNKHPISFGTDFNFNYIPWLPFELSKAFTSKEELLQYLSESTQISRDMKNEKILDNYFSFTQPSTERIVEKTIILLKEKQVSNKVNQVFRHYLMSNIKIFRNILFNKTNKNFTSELMNQKLSGFDYSSAKTLLNTLKNNGFIENNIYINKINSELIKVINK